MCIYEMSFFFLNKILLYDRYLSNITIILIFNHQYYLKMFNIFQIFIF